MGGVKKVVTEEEYCAEEEEAGEEEGLVTLSRFLYIPALSFVSSFISCPS